MRFNDYDIIGMLREVHCFARNEGKSDFFIIIIIHRSLSLAIIIPVDD